MSFAHDARSVKPSAAQNPAHAGPAAALCATLMMLAGLIAQVPGYSPAAQLVGMRMANALLLRGRGELDTWADEVRFAGDSAAYLADDLVAAQDRLAGLGAELRQLERQLVGDPPDLAPPLLQRTTAVRPREAGRTAPRAARAS